MTDPDLKYIDDSAYKYIITHFHHLIYNIKKKNQFEMKLQPKI